MADPRPLIDSGAIYEGNDHINDAMNALYQPNPEGIVQKIPTDEDMFTVFHALIDPFLDPDAEGAFDLYEIHELIINIVLYDALLDNTLYGWDLPPTYQPRRLLELIQYDGLYDVVVNFSNNNGYNEHHIFHWASERLLPYFLEALGPEFIRSEIPDSIGPNGNSYLHSYLQSSFFRILNPDFVKSLLDIGFSLSKKNNDEDTPLHLIVYQRYHHEDPFPTLSKEGRKAVRNDLVRARNKPAIRQYDSVMKRYNRFYQTIVLLFRHGIMVDEEGTLRHPDIMIENKDGVTVGQIIYGVNPSYLYSEDLEKAHELAMGNPTAVKRAREQKRANALRRLPKTNTNRIRQMLGTNLDRAHAVLEKRGKEKKQINNTRQRKTSMQNELLSRNTRRKKQNMHHELLSRKNNRSGGRRTKKQQVKKRNTRC